MPIFFFKKPPKGQSHSLRKIRYTAGVLLWGTATQALAQLPSTAPPSRGSSGGNYLQLMQDYGFDFATLVGLAIAVIALFVVAKNTIEAYSSVQDGRGSWGNVGMNLGAGVLLLVFVIFILTEASGVL